jgi:hypothetical protein
MKSIEREAEYWKDRAAKLYKYIYIFCLSFFFYFPSLE